jgi:hypothetical protein
MAGHPGGYCHSCVYHYLATDRATAPVFQVIAQVGQAEAGSYLLRHDGVAHVVGDHAVNLLDAQPGVIDAVTLILPEGKEKGLTI